MLGEKLATDREPDDWEEGCWGEGGGGGGAGESVAGDDSIFLGGRWWRPGELHRSLSSYCPKHLWST